MHLDKFREQLFDQPIAACFCENIFLVLYITMTLRKICFFPKRKLVLLHSWWRKPLDTRSRKQHEIAFINTLQNVVYRIIVKNFYLGSLHRNCKTQLTKVVTVTKWQPNDSHYHKTHILTYLIGANISRVISVWSSFSDLCLLGFKRTHGFLGFCREKKYHVEFCKLQIFLPKLQFLNRLDDHWTEKIPRSYLAYIIQWRCVLKKI